MNEKFWTAVCERTPHLRMLVIILFILLVLTAFSIALTPAGSASNVVALFDLILIVIATAITVFLQWRCAKNEQRRGEWRPEKRREQ